MPRYQGLNELTEKTQKRIKKLVAKYNMKRKLTIPIRYFEKLSVLTSIQDDYLLEYRNRVSPQDKKFIDRIDNILKGTPRKDMD